MNGGLKLAKFDAFKYSVLPKERSCCNCRFRLKYKSCIPLVYSFLLWDYTFHRDLSFLKDFSTQLDAFRGF